MKIVCISASQVPSSTANSIQVMKACQALAQLEHEVILLVPASRRQETSPEWDTLQQHYGLNTRFEVEWLPAQSQWRRYDFSWSAVRKARQLGAELVYVWPPQAAVMVLLARLPVIVEMHGLPEGKLGPVLFRQYLRLPGKKRLLPITQALANLLEKRYHVHFAKGEAVVSPNGVDLERYQQLPGTQAARLALGLPDAFTAGYTGHLYEGRGMQLLAELAGHFPQVQFLWIGGREQDVAYWKRQLADQQISNVQLQGFVENSRLPQYQAACDILLMPYERQISGSSGGNSAEYCSPMKMFEYMACGRAILSSDLAVIREVLNETNGWLCPPEDSPAWLESFAKLMSDELLCRRLGEQAQQDVQHYTWVERARRALDGMV